MGLPEISIVTPTYNRKGILFEHLNSLARQTLGPERFEVIVVDDGSADGTFDDLGRYRAPYPLVRLRQDNSGLAASRNTGIRAARAPVVLLLDDDVIASPDLVQQHAAPHRLDEGLVVIGSLPYPEDLPRDTFLWYLETIGHFDLYNRKDKYEGGRPPLQPLNGNSSVRKTHLEAVGLYDEQFRDYGGEDVEMGYRLEKAGLRWRYAPEARGYHKHTKTFEGYMRDQYRSGIAIARVYAKYPEIKKWRKIDLVTDRLTSIAGSRWPTALAARLAHHAPFTVRLARLAAARLTGVEAARGAAYYLFKYAGYAAYADGLREGLGRARRKRAAAST